MNPAFSLFDSLSVMVMPKRFDYSSDSSVDEPNEVVQRIVTERLDTLRSNIGDELFGQLSYDDRMLMVRTAGAIDFGRSVDLDNVEKEIESYDYPE